MPPTTQPAKDQKTESLPEGVLKPKFKEGAYISIKNARDHKVYVVESCQLTYKVAPVLRYIPSSHGVEVVKCVPRTVAEDDVVQLRNEDDDCFKIGQMVYVNLDEVEGYYPVTVIEKWPNCFKYKVEFEDGDTMIVNHDDLKPYLQVVYTPHDILKKRQTSS